MALGNVRLLEFIELAVLVAGKPELDRGLHALDLREKGLTALGVALQSMPLINAILTFCHIHHCRICLWGQPWPPPR